MGNYYKTYCVGCGLCENCKYTHLRYREDGFNYPDNQTKEMRRFCDLNCPMGKKNLQERMSTELWGKYLNFYSGFAENDSIRFHGASGGILTALCIYLIESKTVDGIIQTTYDPCSPSENITVVSHSIDDIIRCSGSRYSISNPLKKINNLIEKGKRYAFVGKPCDVVALRNYSKTNEIVRFGIVYFFSFFCAGTPSRNANKQLLKILGCLDNDCISLSYRGDGWPGAITATNKKGVSAQIDYQNGWMNVLGREIRKGCKFCFDSIGEASDISCGDYWCLDKNDKPMFEEREGVNCIFSWSEKGDELLKLLEEKKIINIYQEDIGRLNNVQPNHYYRRSTIFYRWLGMKILIKQTPKYPIIRMIKLGRFISLRKRLGCLKGTIIRVINGQL